MSNDKRQAPRLIFKPPAKPSPPAPRLSEDERLRQARERAEEYRNPPPIIDQHGDVVTEMDEWADVVSNRIEEAMRRGDFDNLRGQGKPLRVDSDPFVPEDQQMAYRLLKNNDMTPTWIAERKEMLRAVESWRENFQRVVGEAQRAWLSASSDDRRIKVRESWARWLIRWDDELVELNRRIGLFNLKQPVAHLEIYKLRLDDELKRIGVTRALEA